ncbi:Immunity protein 52 [Paraburkholderia fungorum]|uniref:Immunity protein 52 n=1 Tax=Paraburkholderia fungorum TaxID=134537 RepID=A0A1H0YWA6_9BURK|nr:immunity 52 family protein [Paraburkholderia fungorum]SDQ19479.1 Immunity protein 52 [Paraburkholderia fungorum]
MTFSLNLELNFRLPQPELPSIETEYGWLWQFAIALQRTQLPIDQWYPPAATEKASMLNRAFDVTGPTTAAIAMANAEASTYPGTRSLGVWNGIEGKGGAVFTDLLGVGSLCSLRLRTKGVMAFTNHEAVADIVAEATRIWPASSVQVGSFKYFSEQKVFENRPGAGWMLYLPRVLTTAEVPEARDLIPVMEGKQQKGTIIVSVIDEPFSAANPEHVRVANSIEIRLVDQDLLPLFTEL